MKIIRALKLIWNFVGIEVYSVIVRDGKEVEYLTNNKFYDFNFQYTNFLNTPVTLKRVKYWISIDKFCY